MLSQQENLSTGTKPLLILHAMNEVSPRFRPLRVVAAAGLLAACLLEAALIIAAPPGLAAMLVPAAAITLAFAAAAPWAGTVILLAVWPLLIDPGRALRILGLVEPLPRRLETWIETMPPYPLLLTAVAAAGLVWAWREWLGSRPLGAGESLVSLLAWSWAIVAAGSAVAGFIALNAPDTPAVWGDLGRSLWHIPLASDLQRASPLAAGRAALLGVLAFAMVRSQVAARPSRRDQAEGALVLSGVLIGLVALMQFADPARLLVDNLTWVSDRRVVGLLRDPNSCGTALAALGTLAAVQSARALRDRRAGSLVRLAAALAIMGPALALTGSRVAWAAVALLALGVAAWRGRRRWLLPREAEPTRRWMPAAATVFGLAWIALLLAPVVASNDVSPNPLVRRLRDTVGALSGQEADPAMRTGFAGRIWHWEAAASMIRERPLTGQGLGTFRLLYERHRSPDNPSERQNAHSQPLQTWAEAGLAGLVFLAGAVGAAIVDRAGARAPQLALAACVLTALTAHPLALLEMQFLLWVLVALAAAAPGPAPQGRLARRTLLSVALACAALQAAGGLRRGVARPAVHGIDDLPAADSTGVPSVWMEGRAGIEITVERPFLLLPLRAGHHDLVEGPVTLSISAEGETVRRGDFEDPFWQLWILDLRRWMGETITLDFAASRTWSPQRDLGLPDPRELSMALGPWEPLDAQVRPEASTPEVWRIPAALMP